MIEQNRGFRAVLGLHTCHRQASYNWTCHSSKSWMRPPWWQWMQRWWDKLWCRLQPAVGSHTWTALSSSVSQFACSDPPQCWPVWHTFECLLRMFVAAWAHSFQSSLIFMTTTLSHALLLIFFSGLHPVMRKSHCHWSALRNCRKVSCALLECQLRRA